MKERIDFKAYRNGRVVYSSWAARGTVAEAIEREVYQTRVNRGDFTHVEVIEPGSPQVTTLLREGNGQ